MSRLQVRNVLLLLGLLPISLGLLSLVSSRWNSSAAPTVNLSWQSNAWYRIDQGTAEAACELPAGGHYQLVIGCLADAAQEAHVQVTLLDPATAVQRTPRQRLDGRSIERSQAWITKNSQGSTETASWNGARLRQPVVRPAGSTTAEPCVREFSLHVTDGPLDDPKQYAKVTARVWRTGERVRIFVDEQVSASELSCQRIDELLEQLEFEIVPRVEVQFGPLHDVDGDGWLTVLLTPWLSRLQGGQNALGGMVRSSDFQQDGAKPLSNRCDMLYLNTALPDGAALKDLLSHEVAHAACLSQRVTGGARATRDEEDWLNEALAHWAEPGWSNIGHRVATFLQDTSRCPLVVPDYYRAGLWRDPGCRGATFLFLKWCAQQHGEDALIRRLACSRNRGTRNLEQASGQLFANLFRNWSISLAELSREELPDSVACCRLPSSREPNRVLSGCRNGQTLTLRGTTFTVVEFDVDHTRSLVLQLHGDEQARWQFSIRQMTARTTDSHAANPNHAVATVAISP